jgi:GT2 family glycosyltransferase
MVLPDEPALPRGAHAAACDLWQSWDGRRLIWRCDVATAHAVELELCIDDIVFERIVLNPPAALGERDFAFPPSGNDAMEFSLRAAGGTAIGRWRVLYGRAASAGVDQWQGTSRLMQALPPAPPPSGEQAPATAIVVPIYNSPHWVQCCIAAVLRWSSGAARLILIDDASTDPAITALLAACAGRPDIDVLRNAQNLGYTRSTNLGIELAGRADVVLLNSDTQVGPRWLDSLRQIAYSDAGIGTVTAVSDNAGAFSVPELEQSCPIPESWTLPMAQRALLQNAGGCLPELPTGNGFCMFVKRALLDRVGALDAAAFPSGYGEENDLCQRAERVGFRHVIAGNVLVHHERSASFGEARRAALGAQGMQVLRSRYPDYEAKVGATLFSFERRVLDYRVRRIYADRDGVHAALPPRPRILFVVGLARPAGLPALLRELNAAHECFVLGADGVSLRLWRYRDDQCLLEQQPTSATAGQIVDEALLKFAIELVHILDDAAAHASVRACAVRLNVPVVDSRADRQLQPLRETVTASVDAPALRRLADYCHGLYESAWRDSASFAEKASSP